MSKTELNLEVALNELAPGLELAALRALADRDVAQDAVQETLVRLVAVIETKGIPHGYTLEAYAYGTLRHVIADERRRRKRILRLPAWLVGNSRSPLDELISAERAAAVAHAVTKLSRADRKLLQRCYVEGERIVEIAAASGEPSERIRKRKSRALERLRAIMRQQHRHVLTDSDDSMT